MALEENEFKCALSNDKHYIVDPISFNHCPHFACKECLLNNRTYLVECKKCKENSEIHFDESADSLELKKKVQKNLGFIFQELESNISLKLGYLEGKFFHVLMH